MKIETEIEIPHPHIFDRGPSYPAQAATVIVMLPAKSTYATRDRGGARLMSQCRTQRGEASCLKLLPVSLAWVSWRCQLPACDGLITAFISTSTPLHHEPSTPSCCECTYDRYSADSLLIVPALEMDCAVCHPPAQQIA
jgi:hypothetical protein